MNVIAFPNAINAEPVNNPVWVGVAVGHSGAGEPEVVVRTGGDITNTTSRRLIAEALRTVADTLEQG